MKIATLLLMYDYGIKDRGVSMEKKYFLPAIERQGEVTSFWLEENGFPNDLIGLQEEIRVFIEANKPDVVFTILMNDEMRSQTFDWMKDKGVYCVNWFCDDMWRFDWSKSIATHLSLAVTVDKYSIHKYEDLGIKAIHGMWGAHVEKGFCSGPHYMADVSFVGSKCPIREWYIHELKNKGINVRCWGSGWENGRAENIYNIFSNSKINLSLSNTVPMDIRFHQYIRDNSINLTGGKVVEQIKARHFEIPAVGGFQLAHYALEIEDYFNIGKEIAVYGNIEDLARQIEYYLRHGREREDIRYNGWKRAKEYSYDNQIKEVFDEIRNNLG